MIHSVVTVAGEEFTSEESVDLARLIHKRFGKSLSSAAAAWRRLLENGATERDFASLVYSEEHTPHCRGECGMHC